MTRGTDLLRATVTDPTKLSCSATKISHHPFRTSVISSHMTLFQCAYGTLCPRTRPVVRLATLIPRPLTEA